MTIIDLLLSISLATDAFLSSIALAIEEKQPLKWYWLIGIAMIFGGFQIGMPVLGMTLSITLYHYITAIDHWLAFILLTSVGGLSLYHTLTDDSDKERTLYHLNGWIILSLAIATSIDALAVGFTLPTISSHINITLASIGIITAVLSLLGMLFARYIPQRFQQPLQLLAAIVLIGLGTKILIQHLVF